MKLISTSIAFVLLAAASTNAPAQQDLQAGQLLYAAPAISDPNFGETVLLLLLQDEQGWRAVALNRPTWVEPAEAFPELLELAEANGPLFFGGPESPNQLVIVYEAGSGSPINARRIFGNIFITTDPAEIQNVAPTTGGAPHVRLFAGHAAWSPGQLEAEIAAGNWRVAAASLTQVFAEDPAALWRSMPTAGGGVSARR
jgi:putative transcriptional regulator